MGIRPLTRIKDPELRVKLEVMQLELKSRYVLHSNTQNCLKAAEYFPHKVIQNKYRRTRKSIFHL